MAGGCHAGKYEIPQIKDKKKTKHHLEKSNPPGVERRRNNHTLRPSTLYYFCFCIIRGHGTLGGARAGTCSTECSDKKEKTRQVLFRWRTHTIRTHHGTAREQINTKYLKQKTKNEIP